MTMFRAADAKVTIDGIAYSVQRMRRGGRVNPIDVSNTEGLPGNPSAVPSLLGPLFRSKLGDIREGTVSFSQAAFDDVTNPYLAPLSLVEGNWYDIKFFPAGLSGPVADYGNCLCTECSEEGTVGGGALISSATFETDGPYTGPGEGD